MEDIKLEKRKKSILERINELFEDSKKRKLNIILFILPFLVAIGIFGFIAFKEAKSLIDLAKGTGEISDANVIQPMNYQLRENATDIQKQYFEELKTAIDAGANAETLAGLVGKNYVADFYTWTNKQGQYDVGGMSYVCSGKYENGDYKENIYLKARDGFYKNINKYINDYGRANILEVVEVNVVSSTKADYQYMLHDFIEAHQLEDESWVKNYDDVAHDCYDVKINWVYKPETKMNLSEFNTSINLLVIENDGRYEIVEASESTIDARQIDDIEEPEEESGTTEE